MKFIYKLMLIVFLIPLVSFANDNAKKHEKTRTINIFFMEFYFSCKFSKTLYNTTNNTNTIQKKQ